MKNDFVTFFGEQGQNRQVSYQSGETLVFGRVNGDFSKTKGNLNDWLNLSGGVAVQIDVSSETAEVSVHKKPSYQAPAKLLKLSVDDRARWVDIPKKIQLERGDHLLVPVDQKSQAALEDLQRNLGYLPADYEDIILNAIRRPSLEWRMTRLEKAAGFEQIANNKDVAATPRDETGAKHSRWFYTKWGLAVSLLIVSGLAAAGGFTLKTYLAAKNETTTKFDQSTPSHEAGKPATYSVKVSTDARGLPEGVVTLLVNGEESERQALDNSGRATFHLQSPPKSDYKLEAKYSGDSRFASSSTELSQSVVASSTSEAGGAFTAGGASTPTASLSIDPDTPVAPGDKVTFKVHVADPQATPTGNVQLILQTGNKNTAEGQRTPLNNGDADLQVTLGRPGTYQFLVKYISDRPATFRNSKSNVVAVIVESRGNGHTKKKDTTDKAAADKAATDKAATDKAATDKAATDKAATDKAATDKAAADKAKDVKKKDQ